MNKVVLQTNVKCRKCRSCNETLAHILDQCVYDKVQIIRRHDEIRDFVSKKLLIIEEAIIPTKAGNLKPDLLVVNQGRGHLVEVTVHHEGTGYLEEGHRSNLEKYTPLLELLAIPKEFRSRPVTTHCGGNKRHHAQGYK
jgi:hypothetical protein